MVLISSFDQQLLSAEFFPGWKEYSFYLYLFDQIFIHAGIFQTTLSYKIQNNIIKNLAKCLAEMNSHEFFDIILHVI